MTDVVLARADIALLSDLGGQRVVLQRLQAVPVAETWDQELVRLLGDDLPSGFRGEGVTRAWQCTARFLPAEHAQLKALTDLFDVAFDDPDGRLLLRTHVGTVSGLDDATAVLVTGQQVTPQGGGVIDVQFTAQAVEYSPAI